MRQTVKSMLRQLGLYGYVVPSFHYLFPMWVPQRRKSLRFFSQFIKQGDLCFDVGANRGELTKVFSMLGAKVVSIEPQIDCLQHLRRLFSNNESVTIVDKAVADHPGCVDFSICEDRNTLSTMSAKFKNMSRYAVEHRWTRTVQVPVTTLDALIQLYGVPDFCKIDVEGAEELVLKGLTQPVRFMSFEYTREFHEDARNCMNYLLSLGQARFNFAVSESIQLLLPCWATSDELLKRLEALPDVRLVGDIYVRFPG